jgi:protein-S-isoprenylcysteine O-methyltransferase Ste14
MAVPQKDKILVAVQILLLLVWVIPVEAWNFELSENLQGLGLGGAVVGFVLVLFAFFQMNTSLSPFPSPRKSAELITGGAFAFARHPIYSGVIFMALGLAVWVGSGYKLVITLLLYIFFHFKSRYEEKLLLRVFPEYAIYRRHTGRFFPKFKGKI